VQLDFSVQVKRAELELSEEQRTLLESFDRAIYKMIRERVFFYDSADVSLTSDDLFQLGRMYVMQAIAQYKPTRGAKLSTFVMLVLWTKFANLGRKFKNHNKRGTAFIGAIDESGALCDGAFRADDGASPFNPFRGVVDSLMDAEDQMIERIDRNLCLDSMSQRQQTLFIDHFVHGYSIKEILDRHAWAREKEIRETLRELKEEMELWVE